MHSKTKSTFVKLKPRTPKTSAQPIPEPTPELSTQTNTTPDYSIAIFQAVGVLTGEVHFADDGQATMTISNKEYQLFYASSKRTAFDALKKEITATGQPRQRLIVYPKVTHFPKRDQHHQIAFQLVAFDKGQNKNGLSEILKNNEFQLRGLWQFIPVCRIPCISVMKNFTPERLDYIKKADLAQKVRFLKSSHIPISWKDAPIRPFRFNPKAGKEQGHPVFVQVKAKFLPQRNTFTFVEQLAPPSENAPKFLKASKDDKTSLQKTKALL
jgi:hypothetical protein